MAGHHASGRSVKRRKSVRYPVDGTAARVPVYQRDGETRVSTGTRRTDRRRTAARRKSRARLNASYLAAVSFLSLVSVFCVALCIFYLQKKAVITEQVERNEKLAVTLTTMRSENDALEEDLENRIDWNYVRDVAVNQLGMKYADEDQIVWYNTDGSSFMTQYQDISSGE